MRRGLYVVALMILSLFLVGQVMAQGAGGGGPGSGYDKEVFNKALDAAKSLHFSGQVVSHDPMCHCLVVKTAKGELTLLDDYAKFMDEYDQAKGLKMNSQITGTYKTVNHIHYLTTVAYAK